MVVTTPIERRRRGASYHEPATDISRPSARRRARARAGARRRLALPEPLASAGAASVGAMHVATPPPAPEEVAAWLSRRSGVDGGPWLVGPAMGDVSSRKYFRARARDGGSLIVAWYPPESSPAYACYRRASLLLAEAGVRTPTIVAVDAESRYMALEDVGDVRLFDLDGSRRSEKLFERAIAIAERIGTLSRTEVAALNPALDRPLMSRELDQTWNVFLTRRLDREAGERLRSALDEVCAALAAEPLEPCHRDFMSRNLMVTGPPDEEELVVIDHQDLRLGPRGYDFASLLHDSCALSLEQTRRFETRGGERTRSDGYHRLVVQRTFKIVGTFHAFASRGAPRYLPLVPRALATGLEHLAALPGLADLAGDLKRQLACRESACG